MRASLFRYAQPGHVRPVLERFWNARGAVFIEPYYHHETYTLQAATGDWGSVLSWDGGWGRYEERRAAHVAVARELHVPALFVFVYHGRYWGYELVDASGEPRDQFVQRDPEYAEVDWFPGRLTRGDAEVFASVLDVPHDAVAPYFVQLRAPEHHELLRDLPPVRHGDRYARNGELAVLDFFAALGVGVSLVDDYVTFNGPPFATWSIHRNGRWAGDGDR
jgi:hypothetical protein